MNEYLVAKLKEGRLSKGLKQSDVTRFTSIKNTTLSNYENGVTEPDIDTFLQLCELYDLDYAEILGEAYGLSIQGSDFDIKPSEIEHIKKYRLISKKDADGKALVDSTVDYLCDKINQFATKDALIAELEAAGQPSAARQIISLIDFQPHVDNVSRTVEYFRSASAGDGIFIMGNEGTEQVMIPDVPGASEADYAIKISGTSMEPDYHDGDVALVSQTSEMRYGDVGIFVVNGNAYIKEYRKKELVSRNPKSPNVIVAEHDNIVCMGKVVGKILEEEIERV